MSSENNITHKELLTFSNLTNLDWHFVDLYTKSDEEKKRSTNLNDLLTPGAFYRVYDNGEREYCYGSVGKGSFVETQGLVEMRQAAGIAMEYLEKWQQWKETDGAEGTNEGEFLGDWEVIYGGDNYKSLRF